MSIMPIFSLIFNGGCVDSDTSSFFLGSLINRSVVNILGLFFETEVLSDG